MKANPVIRVLAYVLGIVCWAYLSVPRYDLERRRSTRYRKALGTTKSIWIVSGSIMLVLFEAVPSLALPLSMALSLLTTFLCYMILDEIE